MITTEDIIKWSKPHRVPDARKTVLTNDHVIFSIVGGSQGLYGDFNETFEVAILDKETQDFITNLFHSTNGDDVLPYLQRDELERLVNKVFPADFQVL